MITICFLSWCLFGTISNETRIVAAQDAYKKNEYIDRLLMFEMSPVFGGMAFSSQARSVIIGMLPLRIGNNLIHVNGGISATNNALPWRGTRLNWCAEAHIGITDHLGIGWWHFSNGGIGKQNPSLDAIAISWKF